MEHLPRGPESSPLVGTITFDSWAICLPRLFLRCRTRFGWHLKRSFTVCWHEAASSPATSFPLPVPHPGCFRSSGPGLSKKRLAAVARQRLLHIIVYALNHLFLGRHPTLSEIGRRPNSLQLRVFQRLRSLIDVCGASQESFPLVPGRSGPELAACLHQLEKFAEQQPELSQSYVQPRPTHFVEDPGLIDTEEHPELRPYKNLQVNRLKLVGEGQWPMESFISGPLWLPFQEPRFLLHGERIDFSQGPNFKHESREENLSLAKLWDSRGLLALYEEPLAEGMFSRVFNAYKSEFVDRQIGDRRIPNMMERSVDGPSRHLPPGFMLTNLSLCPYVQQLFGSVTDRRDFYHQAEVSAERARSNMLPFKFDTNELAGLGALAQTLQRADVPLRSRKDRQVVGDGFGGESCVKFTGSGKFFPCFRSLFQGDHLGVEFALQSHEEMLQRHGLLHETYRLKGHAIFPLADRWEGLIIDDYFVISREQFGAQPLNTFAGRALAQARQVYHKCGVLGSPEKDVEAATKFKAAGAEVDSSLEAVKRGITTVAAPLAKRIALSTLSLRAAALPLASAKLLARLSGSWTSVLMYRRCFSAVVEELFRDAAEAEAAGSNILLPLRRKAATELCLLSVFAPIISSNIATKYQEKVFASDASLGKGAFVSTEIDAGLSEVLWLGSDKRGCYSRLDGPELALLSAAGEETHELHSSFVEQPAQGPQKSPLLYFDFVEFYGGSGRVSACMAELGHSVAPPLGLSSSRHYNMTDARLLEWAMHMIEQKRFRSFLSEPPCTTFSPAAHPAVRSYQQPEGYDMSCPKTFLGNLLANRSFVLLRHGRRYRTPCGKEQPCLSKMGWLKAWRALCMLGFRESIIASCQFGSPHKKEFKLLTYLLDAEGLEVKCPGGHTHVRIEGSLTKGSAVYVWDLAAHFAKFFSKALRKVAFEESEEKPQLGFESVVINDVLAANTWAEEKVWDWRRKSHINVLEGHGALAVLSQASLQCQDSRFNCLLDSRVAKGALAKGRSSSAALQFVCRRAMALQVAFGLFPGWGFAPARLNVADDPTRRLSVRLPVQHSISRHLPISLLRSLHALALPRHLANWLRLILLVWILDFAEAAGFDLDFSPAVSPEGKVDTKAAVGSLLVLDMKASSAYMIMQVISFRPAASQSPGFRQFLLGFHCTFWSPFC